MPSDFKAPSVYEAARNPAAMAERRRVIAAWEAAYPEIARDLPEAWRLDEHWEAERARKRAAARAEASIPRMLAQAGAPQRAADAWRTADRNKPGMVAVAEFLASSLTFGLLLGDVGTGKTVASVEALAWGIRRGSRACWRRAVHLARLPSFGDEADLERDRIFYDGILVIDDLGAESLTDYWLGIFGELIDERHEGGRKTLITSNATRATLATRYGKRFVDRMRQDGRAWDCGTESLRVKPGSEHT